MRAVDDSFNVGAPSSVTFTVGPAVCPCSIFPADVPPAVDGNDGQAIEVGVKVRSDQTGTLSGVRLYKATGDTITLTGHVYSSTGILLASTAPTSVAGSGWQVLPLTTPLGLSADTTYVVTYFSPSGDYAYTVGGLSTEVANPPLRALADGAQGADGVYRYGGGFPTNGSGGVELLGRRGVHARSDRRHHRARPIVGHTPAASATAVATSSPVTVTFSEAMDPTSISGATITLSDRQSVPVPATVSYDAATRTATLTPDLGPRLPRPTSPPPCWAAPAGVKDVAGNPLATDAHLDASARSACRPTWARAVPIVVITNSADPFSRYYAEILRAEGLNEFSLVDVGSLDRRVARPPTTRPSSAGCRSRRPR